MLYDRSESYNIFTQIYPPTFIVSGNRQVDGVTQQQTNRHGRFAESYPNITGKYKPEDQIVKAV